MHFSIPETQEFANGSNVFTVSTPRTSFSAESPFCIIRQSRTHTETGRKSCEIASSTTKAASLLNQVLELNKSFTRRYCKQVQGGKKKSENSHKPRRAAAEASFDTRFFQGQTKHGITTRKVDSLMKCLHAKPLRVFFACLRCAILFRNFVVVDKTGTFWMNSKLSHRN